MRGAKFNASKLSVYIPGARWLKTNSPISDVTASRVTPRLSSRAVTVTSWMTAMVSSYTKTRMLPVFVCAHKARLPIIASDAMLKNRNEMATALINRECTFVTAL